MHDNHFKLVNYSEKAVALLIEKDGAITEELEMLGGRYNWHLSCGPGWIFSRKKSYEALIKLLECYGITYKSYELNELPTVNAGKNQDKEDATGAPEWILTNEERRNYWLSRYPGDKDKSYFNYLYKNYPVIVRLCDGECVPIESDKLKTEFWFGESDWQGPTYEEAAEAAHEARTKEDYFINENLDKLRSFVACLEDPEKYAEDYSTTYNRLWLSNWNSDGANEWRLHWSNVDPASSDVRFAIGLHDSRLPEMYDQGLYKDLTPENRARLLYAYKLALDQREKRCRAYLKRYGLSKISARTYWMDR